MIVLQTLIMSAAPPERAGSVAGVNETSSEFGIALGIALLGSLAAAVSGFARAEGHDPASAFTAGYAVAAIVAAGVCLALAAGTLLVARRASSTPQAQPEDAAAADVGA
jgi:DHA2 family multidrug resistance protein-like MFS transporter